MSNLKLFARFHFTEDITVSKKVTSGIFPSQMIREFVQNNIIDADDKISEEQIQPASLDLRLGTKAFHVRASFLPNLSKVLQTIEDKDLIVDEIDLTNGGMLQKGCVYIIPLKEKIYLPNNVSAKANPRSTVGRLDIFVRLLTDHARAFDFVEKAYRGELFVEVVPRTYSVILHENTRLNQLRFMTGKNVEGEDDKKLTKLDRNKHLVFNRHEGLDDDIVDVATIRKGLRLRIDLWGRHEKDLIGFKAKANAPYIDFSKVNSYDPHVFWEPIYSNKKKSLILDPGDFFILTSKEKVRIPPDYAAEMVAFEPTMGELRVHYAGFFDPGFGYGENNIKGTPAVMEIRAYETPYLLEHNQFIASLQYFPLLDVSDKVYGPDIGSSYQFQKLTLSKQFKRFEL